MSMNVAKSSTILLGVASAIMSTCAIIAAATITTPNCGPVDAHRDISGTDQVKSVSPLLDQSILKEPTFAEDTTQLSMFKKT